MLVEFSVGNFMSFRDRQTLRLDAAPISDYKDQLITNGVYRLLPSVVIYGANASGKSNLLRAIAAMQRIVTTSAESSSKANLPVIPFRLSTETEKAPSSFEVLMLIDGFRYRYGFEADRKAVRAEWLYVTKKSQEKPLFLREDDGIEVMDAFVEGNDLEARTRDNALFLSVCDQFNGPVAGQIIAWFDRLETLNVERYSPDRVTTYNLLHDVNYRPQLLTFLAELNLGFNDLHIKRDVITDPTWDDPTEGSQLLVSVSDTTNDTITTTHSKYDKENRLVGEETFDLDTDESAGTQRLFDVIGPVFLTLITGGVLVVDELDARLHPLLTQAIVRLFNLPERNPKHAQLVFATHDTNLLTYGHFRRDQIYFTEKNRFGASTLYSLVEYQEPDGSKIRKDRSFEKDYFQGRYGAIPFITETGIDRLNPLSVWP